MQDVELNKKQCIIIKMKQRKYATQRINVGVNIEKLKLIISKLKPLRKKTKNANKYLLGSELKISASLKKFNNKLLHSVV